MLAENVIFEKGTTFSSVGKLSGSWLPGRGFVYCINDINFKCCNDQFRSISIICTLHFYILFLLVSMVTTA